MADQDLHRSVQAVLDNVPDEATAEYRAGFVDGVFDLMQNLQ